MTAGRSASAPASAFKRWALLSVGWSAVALGSIGVFLPLLPTTPFLLLAAVCFARSSEPVHRWLLGHRYFGSILRDYMAGCGITLRAKLFALSFLWVTISCSAVWMVDSAGVRLLLFAVALSTTVYLLRQPTCPAKATP
ncbi:MAG: YbaN family protein [Deltaproteobacteria bacterium]|nr:YbaN family protein [Deltaproteobacteria bacterium]